MNCNISLSLILLGLIICFSCSNYSISTIENEIEHLHELSKHGHKDSSLMYINAAKKLIDKNDQLSDSFHIEHLFRKGIYFLNNDLQDSASYYLHRTIDRVQAPNRNRRNRDYFENLWVLEEHQNRIANAIHVAQRFIDISDEENNEADLVYAYNYLERAYLDLQNYEKSLHYNTKVLELAKRSGDIDMYVITANSKAQSYYYYLDKKVEAFELLDSLTSIDCHIDATRQLFRTYGILQFWEGNYYKAIQYYEHVLQLSKEILDNQNFNLLESYNNITEAYLELEEYDQALKYLDSTKAIIEPTSFPYYVTVYNTYRFMYNYRTQEKESALIEEYLELVEENKRQQELKINEKLVALELANEKERLAITEKNNIKLKNLKLVGTLLFLLLLMLIGLMYYYQRRSSFEKMNLQMHQRLLRSQMKPHFIFNTLSVIQHQINQNPLRASKYLLKFSRLLRLILTNSERDYVALEDELDVLRRYMDLQLMRFPNKFEYKMDLINFESADLVNIPPMLIQPFIENSIEHGFKGVDYTGKINVKLIKGKKFIDLHIEDNGIGIHKENLHAKKSMSTDMISTFIRKVTKQEIIIKHKKGVDNPGVIIKFLIPYKLGVYE